MKKSIIASILLVILIASVAAMSGCVEKKKETKETEGAGPWYAFDYEKTVTPKSGSPGKISSYKYKVTESDNGVVQETEIANEYKGTETVDILGYANMTAAMNDQATVVDTVETYKLVHTIRWLRDDTGGEHPDSATVTTWIPKDVADQYTVGLGQMWVKLNYTDTDGNAGDIYYSNSSTSVFGFYSVGEVETPEPLYWVYGGLWWSWFYVFATNSEVYELKDGFSFGAPGFGISYTVTKKDVTVSGYTFEAFECKYSIASTEGSGTWSVTLVPDMPIPLNAYWGSTSSGSGSGTEIYSFDLIEISLG